MKKEQVNKLYKDKAEAEKSYDAMHTVAKRYNVTNNGQTVEVKEMMNGYLYIGEQFIGNGWDRVNLAEGTTVEEIK